MRVWYNAEPNIFMSLNDAERQYAFRVRAGRARQADTHCHSLRVRRA